MPPRVKVALLLLVLLTIAIAGFVVWTGTGGLRALRSLRSTPSPDPQQEVVDIFRKAAQERASAARQNCIREKLGPERYAAVALSPQSITPAEQFAILPCSATRGSP